MTHSTNSFTTIEQGTFSDIKTCFQRVITSATEWEEIWQQHKPQTPVPEVDFTLNQVVAVFAGEKPTGGFSVDLISVEVTNQQIDITVKYIQPGREAFTIQPLTQPHHIVKIPQQT